MKKQLLAGTAIAAACVLVAGGAAAQDKKMMKPSISVNGYSEAVVGGIIDEDLEANASDTTALDVRSDAEIHFNGRASLDSGLKIHARVELEGMHQHSGTDTVDEYFLSVAGSFGNIILGGTGGAPVKMLTGLSGSWATSVGQTLNFHNVWVPSAAGNHYNLQHSRLDTGDAEKLTYLSPKFGGFQVGATYSPNRVNDDNWARNNVGTGVHDGLEVALTYVGKFGDVGIGIGAGMTRYQGANDAGSGMTCVAVPGTADGDAVTTSCTANSNPTDDLSDWLVAARFDFGGGFRVAIAHKRVTNDDEATQSQLTDAGVRYVAGANSFSLVGSVGEMDMGNASHTAIMASYARALGPGVKAHTSLLWNETENTGGTMTNTGTTLITGVKVVF